MRTVNKEARRTKQIYIMEKCYDCYAENGLNSVGVKTVADACGCNVASIYQYFDNLDDLIIQSTEYAKSLELKIGIPHEKLTSLIFIFIRACVHYAMFEDEFYLQS